MNEEKKKFLELNFRGNFDNTVEIYKLTTEQLFDLMDTWKSVVCKEQKEICSFKAVKYFQNNSYANASNLSETISNSPEPEL